jgi:osmotically inducible protein OsmC
MATDRRAEVRWQGSLTDGSGTIVSTTTGSIGEQPVSWAARSTDETGGVTSPEELIAAAHAACFAMALSNVLAKDGHAPDELRTSATVTFQAGEGITGIALTVEGSVPGLDEEGFREAARTAKENCPVSQALAAVPEISLEVQLAA